MECMHCKGQMDKGLVPLHIDRKGCHVTIDQVPAWVCSQCGEHLFDEKEVEGIQDLIGTIEQKSTSLKLPA